MGRWEAQLLPPLLYIPTARYALSYYAVPHEHNGT